MQPSLPPPPASLLRPRHRHSQALTLTFQLLPAATLCKPRTVTVDLTFCDFFL
jgi:hypothetical protein